MAGSAKRRLRAGEDVDVGSQRYQLMREAAKRVKAAIVAGYYLEAVTLTESILSERLEKRAQCLHDHTVGDRPKALVALKNGFANLGRLVDALRNHDPDPELREALRGIDAWRSVRNSAIHEMAKYGVGAKESWAERLTKAAAIADQGVAVLLAYDLRERRLSHEARNKQFASATCPDALGPLGQEPCSFCASASVARRRRLSAST